MKNARNFLVLSLVSALALPALGCRRQDEATEAKLNLIIENQEAMKKQLTAIQQARPAAGAAGAGAARKRPDPNVTYFMPVASTDAYVGPEKSKVTIVEAFEYACPYCAMLAVPLEKVHEANPDVKIVSKQFVVHPDTATLPALGACAATKQGKFAAYNKKLWETAWPMEGDRPNFKRDQLSAENLDKIAAAAGLDVGKFKADRDGAECKKELDRQRQELAAIGVSGTPALYINGKPYQGARTPEAIGEAIKAAKAEADSAIGKGTATADNYYDTLMKSAQKSL
jgi:protein-disulfide isomerase